ncbi:MAG: tagatose 1,6-diphosphate aldolase [Chloroflexi bacterium]|nr:tagatose 1,6-diphosphate aldolase [Chloroflexota bacterium]
MRLFIDLESIALLKFIFSSIISISKMKNLTIGKMRGLQQIANADGILTICAMDHRGSLRSMINEENPGKVSDAEMVERKLELCSSLAEHTSAVLLDPIFGAAQCISRGVLAKTTGLLVSLEASGYSGQKEHRLTELLKDWSVEKIKRMGASAVKILLYYRPDLKQLARQQLDTVNTVAKECIEYDIPFLVEPVSYPVGSEVSNPQEFARVKGQLVIETARQVTALPIDVLKAEFPADLRYQKDKAALIELCHQLDGASPVPWVILSAGVDYELFCQQVEIACRGGASGFLGGRAIWQEAMRIDDTRERVRYLRTVGADRLRKLNEIAGKYAVPWYKKYGVAAHELVDISPSWYQEY